MNIYVGHGTSSLVYMTSGLHTTTLPRFLWGGVAYLLPPAGQSVTFDLFLVLETHLLLLLRALLLGLDGFRRHHVSGWSR